MPKSHALLATFVRPVKTGIQEKIRPEAYPDPVFGIYTKYGIPYLDQWTRSHAACGWEVA